jgi:hypothetical protein
MSGADDGRQATVVAANRRIIATMLGFAVVMIGGALLVVHLRLGMAGAIPLMLVAIGFTVLIMRGISRQMAATGCGSPAMLRYNGRMLYGSIGYMAALIGAVNLYKQTLVSGPLLWVVALVPAVFVLAMVWAMAMLIVEERDEYLRHRVIKQTLFATSGLLAVATIWGFLEQFALVPHVPAWAAVPLFAVFLGLSQCFRGIRQ